MNPLLEPSKFDLNNIDMFFGNRAKTPVRMPQNRSQMPLEGPMNVSQGVSTPQTLQTAPNSQNSGSTSEGNKTSPKFALEVPSIALGGVRTAPMRMEIAPVQQEFDFSQNKPR
jgi:hypothetical protein